MKLWWKLFTQWDWWDIGRYSVYRPWYIDKECLLHYQYRLLHCQHVGDKKHTSTCTQMFIFWIWLFSFVKLFFRFVSLVDLTAMQWHSLFCVYSTTQNRQGIHWHKLSGSTWLLQSLFLRADLEALKIVMFYDFVTWKKPWIFPSTWPIEGNISRRNEDNSNEIPNNIA